jgi:isochorismate synthase EntC
MRSVQEKCKQFKISLAEVTPEVDLNEQNELLQTIRVPHNLTHLTGRLPKSNYVKKREVAQSLKPTVMSGRQSALQELT